MFYRKYGNIPCITNLRKNEWHLQKFWDWYAFLTFVKVHRQRYTGVKFKTKPEIPRKAHF